MGAHLVAKALTTWAPVVGDKAFRVLVRMALTALDEATETRPACLYFDDPDNLAAAMGGTGSALSRGRLARRGIEELIGRGAVERVNRAKTGSRQVYRLTLWNAPKPYEAKRETRPKPDHWRGTEIESSDVASPPGSDVASPNLVDVASPEVRTWHVHPRNQEETLEELDRNEGVDVSKPVTVRARDADTEPEPVSSLPPCGDPTCFLGYVKVPGTKGNQRCPVCNPARTKPAWSS